MHTNHENIFGISICSYISMLHLIVRQRVSTLHLIVRLTVSTLHLIVRLSGAWIDFKTSH